MPSISPSPLFSAKTLSSSGPQTGQAAAISKHGPLFGADDAQAPESSSQATGSQENGEAAQTQTQPKDRGFFAELWDDIQQNEIVKGVQQAGAVLTHSLKWYKLFKAADAKSSVGDRLVSIFNLISARVQEGLLSGSQQAENNQDDQKKQAIYALYADVLGKFPMLALQKPDFPHDLDLVEKVLTFSSKPNLREELDNLQAEYNDISKETDTAAAEGKAEEKLADLKTKVQKLLAV